MVPWDAEAESLDKRAGRGTSPRASTGILKEACRRRVSDEETSWLKSESKDTKWYVNTGLQGGTESLPSLYFCYTFSVSYL